MNFLIVAFKNLCYLPLEVPSAKRGALLSAETFLYRLYKDDPANVDDRAADV